MRHVHINCILFLVTFNELISFHYCNLYVTIVLNKFYEYQTYKEYHYNINRQYHAILPLASVFKIKFKKLRRPVIVINRTVKKNQSTHIISAAHAYD